MSDTQTDKFSEALAIKEPITYDEQVKKISEKGFIIEDTNSCKVSLPQANYYRLLAYYLPFKKKTFPAKRWTGFPLSLQTLVLISQSPYGKPYNPMNHSH